MDFSSAKSLARELVNMRLITLDQANVCLRQLDRAHRSGSDMLQSLLDNNFLTPFQAESIRKLDTGLLILGGNKLLYPNASGSFARVFRGENLDTGEMVAVKVLRNRWNNEPDTIDLFQREAELGQKLKHPNIVSIYNIGFEEGYHFFTMEFVEGGSLRDFVQIRKSIAPLETLKYSIDIARGLEYALKFGVTHRDLKTTNVLFSVDGKAKLIDFGLATDDDLLKKIGEGNVQHALEYSTLEKGTGAPRNDPRSDLFFLGTIMYEMLLGQPPYPRTRSREERKQITRYRNIRLLSSAMPQCPVCVSDIVERLLHINPEERYQSATELLVDLQAAQAKLAQENRQAAEAAPAGRATTANSTLLCIESRVREQDILREYFTRHGFRVLMLSDADRAAKRIKNEPPHLAMMMVTRMEDAERMAGLQNLVKVASEKKVPTLIVVPDLAVREQLYNVNDGLVHFHQQPLALRNMRNQLGEMASANGIELSLDPPDDAQSAG